MSDVDSIDGLSPAISIDQINQCNPRSTVATVTEIYDYLRLLFARVGVLSLSGTLLPDGKRCGKPVQRRTAQSIIDEIMKLSEGAKLTSWRRLLTAEKGEFQHA